MLSDATVRRLRFLHDRDLNYTVQIVRRTTGTVDDFNLPVKGETVIATVSGGFAAGSSLEALMTRVPILKGDMRFAFGTDVRAGDRLKLTHYREIAISPVLVFEVEGSPKHNSVGVKVQVKQSTGVP